MSYERGFGPGIANIYGFLRDSVFAEEPDWLREKHVAEDMSAVISHEGLTGSSDICAEALNLFVLSAAPEAGNLALRGKATGGVHIGGGIAPKILAKLEDGTFMRASMGRDAGVSFRRAGASYLERPGRAAGAAFYAAKLKN